MSTPTAALHPLQAGFIAPPATGDRLAAPGSHFGLWAGRAALGLATGYLLDQEVGHRARWSRAAPTITEFPAAAGVSPETAVLVTAGFNSRPEATAAPLRPVFEQVGRTALFHDSHSGLSIQDNVSTIADWARQTGTKNLVLYGPSMGTLIHLAVAPQLTADNGLNLFMLMDSSPYNFDDILGSSRRATVRLLSRMSLRGGPATRIALEAFGYSIDNAGKQKTALSGLVHAIRKIGDSTIQSNAQCIGRAKLLVEADNSQHYPYLQEVPFAYLGPEDPANDRVVNQVTALQSHQAQLQQTILHITHSRTGHANPASRPTQYRRMVSKALSGFGLRVA